MLKTKVIEKIRPSKKVQELFNSNQLNYTSVNGYIQIIENEIADYNEIVQDTETKHSTPLKMKTENFMQVFLLQELTI